MRRGNRGARELRGTRGSHPGQRTWPTAAAAGGLFAIACTLALLGAAGGCTEQGSLLPNSDPALRKPWREFAADAATRHPYKADAPRGGEADGRAQINYTYDNIEVANFSKQDWTIVEIWINRTHVLLVPTIDKDAAQTKTLGFHMFFDAHGKPFPRDNADWKSQVRQVEMLRDGTMYQFRTQLSE